MTSTKWAYLIQLTLYFGVMVAVWPLSPSRFFIATTLVMLYGVAQWVEGKYL